MSGTSVDAIDAVVVRFSPGAELVATHTLAYPAELRATLLALAVPGKNEIDRLGQADVAVGRHFAQAVRDLLSRAGLASRDVRAIGSHGQTIRHRPGLPVPFTLQIGDPNVIAAETGLPVVADFRRKDMALGGQGAPLVPAFHEALFRVRGRNRVVVNIGGIANLTVLPADGSSPVLGFDTGPGNTLLDAWARRVLGELMDRDGIFAARGRVRPELLGVLLSDPYFSRRPPKSTGPEYFAMAWLERYLSAAGSLADADVQATLVALTGTTVAKAIINTMGDSRPDVFVCGGGARHPGLMRALREELPESAVETTAALGVDPGWVEAMAFAWLARQRLAGEAGNCPAVTGATRPAVLGGIFSPA
ncbi:MAG: anhydro-N-acetylmuramic acid kinase [Opitutus sp.]|nr:anhydro-N-acetylmuramic acid kinase [Opitutus sp.]